jgi:glycosyltransferase involved in cell wall biosynthesis
MRILHVVPSLLPESGGPSRTVPELCRALTKVGTDVTLFSTHTLGNGLAVDPSGEPYEVVLFPAQDGSLSGALQIHKAIKERASDFDLIHIHSLWNFTVTLAAMAARKAKIRYVITPRGMLSEACLRQRRYSLKHAYAWTFDRRTVEGAARLHFLNRYELRASQSGWFRNPQHFLARNGVDLNLKSVRPGSFRARFPELEGRPIMLFLGRLHPMKGLDLQLQALQRLIPKYPGLIWLLIGPDDGEWPRLNSLINKTGLGAHVKWIGPVMGDERFSALADADVVLQTSFYECQSMTVNEAVAVGVPLVVTDSINYGEVQSAGAGYVVRRDAAEIAIAIDVILRTSELGQEMRKAGRRFAAAELSWTRIARTVNRAYMDLLSVRSDRRDVSSDSRDVAMGKRASAG